MSLRICPVELHLCNRPGCSSGMCEMSMDRLLTLCMGCGGLGSLYGIWYCIDCDQIEEAGAEETSSEET